MSELSKITIISTQDNTCERLTFKDAIHLAGFSIGDTSSNTLDTFICEWL